MNDEAILNKLADVILSKIPENFRGRGNFQAVDNVTEKLVRILNAIDRIGAAQPHAEAKARLEAAAADGINGCCVGISCIGNMSAVDCTANHGVSAGGPCDPIICN